MYGRRSMELEDSPGRNTAVIPQDMAGVAGWGPRIGVMAIGCLDWPIRGDNINEFIGQFPSSIVFPGVVFVPLLAK